MSEELNDKQRRVREILLPDGEPLGEQGHSRRGTIRVMPGGLEAAYALLVILGEFGEAEERIGYPGPFFSFESVDHRRASGVGLREESHSGEPTLDVKIDYVPEITKIKFTPASAPEETDEGTGEPNPQSEDPRR